MNTSHAIDVLIGAEVDKAIALLREASAADPENVEVRLLLGTLGVIDVFV